MKKSIYKDLVAASSRPLLLSILAGGDSYGYEIIKQVKRLSAGDLEWSGGMLYPLLHRLEKDGLIEGYWELAEEGRPRKYYSLTARGEKQLATDRKSWRAVYGTLELSWRGGRAPAG
ncbi:PadR family transcriptional regulator [Candidatus Palauibacter sp.]|uniref:PadR family transcriptional regulator n=1 Tax=Candidatus Palauibacter sp. TaxID=3101350 RepID=UPI003B025C7F